MFEGIDPSLIIITSIVSFGIFLYQLFHYYVDQIPNIAEKQQPLKPSNSNKNLAYKILAKHSEEFNIPEILTLVGGKIHVAIGKWDNSYYFCESGPTKSINLNEMIFSTHLKNFMKIG